MLSRIAESLFWIGRYVERADGTARILDVHLERLNHLAPGHQQQVARDLLQVMGTPVEAPGVSLSELLRVLVYDRETAGSIAGALGAARENARRARETVSSSLWECLNTTYFGIGGHRQDVAGTYRFCQWVIERAATASGLMDGTMSHDESWRFLVLGRSLERADITARMLATCDSNPAGLSWVNMLRCAGAYESYLRTRKAAFDDRSATQFLLMDPRFPRSIVYSLRQAEEALAHLEAGDRQAGSVSDARRIVGQARTFLEFHRSENLMDELPEHMERVQRSVARASEETARRYYSGTEQAWAGELT